MSCTCLVPDLTVCKSGACCVGSDDFSPEVAAIASELAIQTLWALTGRRFTRCKPITVRPCQPKTCCQGSVLQSIYSDVSEYMRNQNMGVMSFTPSLDSGEVHNIKACGSKCPGQECCCCAADCEFSLPGPVCAVTRVQRDGIELGSALYTLYRDSRGIDHLAFKTKGTTVIRPFDTVPLVAPFSQQGGGTLTPNVSLFDGRPGVELTDIGNLYVIQVASPPSAANPDLAFDLEIPPGGGTFTIGQPPNGHWTATALPGGGEPTLTKVGNVLTVGPATRPNEPIRIRIRAEKDYNVSAIAITQTAGSPAVLQQFTWTNLRATQCGVDQWGPSEKAGRLFATAQPYDLDDRWTFVPDPTDGTNQTNYGGGVWGPTVTPGPAFYNEFPTLPGGVLQFDYVADGAPEPFAIAPAWDPVNAPSGAYEWSSVAYPNGTVLGVGDSIQTSTISDPDIDDGSRYRLTVTAGSATVVSARALEPSANFSATVEFQETQVTNYDGAKEGTCCPPCQDYNVADGEIGSWSVTYTYGENWPAGADKIAGLLACDYARALTDDPTCQLPADVVSLARQGINIELPNLFDLVKLRLTGIRIVDRWITLYNPLGLTHRARVWSPDMSFNRREIES